MDRKVLTLLNTRFYIVLALLFFGASYYSFAQSNLSESTTTPDSISTGLSSSLSAEEKNSANKITDHSSNLSSEIGQPDSLYFDSVKVNEVAVDTSDSAKVHRDILLKFGGEEGWRMMTAPTRALTFSSFLDSIWVQGISDSDDPIAVVPTVLSWSEANKGFTQKPTTMAGSMEVGKGYIIYFFADDNPSEQGLQGGFPKTLKADGKEVQEVVSVRVTASDGNDNDLIDSDEGWNLIGNPFNEELSVEKVKEVFKASGDSLNEYIYAWNRASGNEGRSFKALREGEAIAPYQSFFVKYGGTDEINTTVELRKEELTEESPSLVYDGVTEPEFAFTVHLSDGERSDAYDITFSNQGSRLLNNFDIHKLFSLNEQSLKVFGRKGDGIIQANSLPAKLPSTIEVPIDFEYDKDGELTLQWENLKTVPHEWTLTLRDTERNTEVDLRTNTHYRFMHETERKQPAEIPAQVMRPRVIKDNSTTSEQRFILSINPGVAKKVANEETESIKLKPNFPNPFNQETTISYELSEDSEVTLSIWNMIGQKVATLVDDLVEAGPHEERWMASQMPSGMYIARLEVGNQVFTRKMTLIK